MKAKQSGLIFAGLTLIAFAIPGWASSRSGSSSPAIPAGLEIQARIDQNLSSESAHPGDTFQCTLATPIVVRGRVLFAKGATISGQVTGVHRSGRLSDPGVLELVLTSVSSGGMSSALVTQVFRIQGTSHTKNNVTKIGGGTAAGAIIGGIVGGGKGAAIGAGVGAGAGTATAAATGKRPATVEAEAVLIFVTGSEPTESVLRSSGPPADRSEKHYVRRRHTSEHDEDEDDDHDDDRDDRFRSRRDDDSGYRFGQRDRQVLEGCLAGYDFESLPPGIQKKLARGGTLPPGQAKKLRSLPDSCTARLPQTPRGIVRIIFGDRVILVDSSNRILDILVF